MFLWRTCGYTSEAPHWGTSDEYPHPVIVEKKNKFLDIPLYLELWSRWQFSVVHPFQYYTSNWDDENNESSVQWSATRSWAELCLQRDLNPGTSNPKLGALTTQMLLELRICTKLIILTRQVSIYLIAGGIPFRSPAAPGYPCSAWVDGINNWLARCASVNKVW